MIGCDKFKVLDLEIIYFLSGNFDLHLDMSPGLLSSSGKALLGSIHIREVNVRVARAMDIVGRLEIADVGDHDGEQCVVK